MSTEVMGDADRPKVRASGLFFDERGVLLGKHRGHGFYTLIGGSWELGETLEEAVEREFLEETGMPVNATRLIFVGELHTRGEQVLDMIFHVTSRAERQDLVQEKSASLDELRFVPIPELPRTQLEPKEFWRVWIPRLANQADLTSFLYGGVYDG
jgi:8-oxo-dGTP diphosphatase